MQSDRCLYLSLSSPISKPLVYCGQTVARMKIKLGVQIGLGPGHIVLDGAQLPLPQRGITPNFRPISVVA